MQKDLKVPIKDSEMQKIADHYLKNNKTPGPDSFQTELIQTMSPEQWTVNEQWINEILTTGEITTKVTEEDMTGIQWFCACTTGDGSCEVASVEIQERP